jgi:tetratricopeptide (TPR) repeat protein
MSLGLLFHLLSACRDLVGLFEKSKRKKFDRQYQQAISSTGRDSGTLLAAFCEDCRKRVAKKPHDSQALYRWGVALMWRASRASGNEEDRLYEQSAHKLAQAQKASPNDGEICAARVEALRRRADLQTGDLRRRMLKDVCELCEARAGIYAAGAWDGATLDTWGRALLSLGSGTAAEEADRLYELADRKLGQAYALAPERSDILSNRSTEMLWRATLHTGEKQRELLRNVVQICEQQASEGKGGAQGLVTWGTALGYLAVAAGKPEAEGLYEQAEARFSRALYLDPENLPAQAGLVRTLGRRALLKRGDEYITLITRACEECERFSRSAPDCGELLNQWGNLLEWRAVSSEAGESVRLFAEAEEKYSRALTLKPGDIELTCALAHALTVRATMLGGGDAPALTIRACDLLARACERNPSSVEALRHWAQAAEVRMQLVPGEESLRMRESVRAKLTALASIELAAEQAGQVQ